MEIEKCCCEASMEKNIHKLSPANVDTHRKVKLQDAGSSGQI